MSWLRAFRACGSIDANDVDDDDEHDGAGVDEQDKDDVAGDDEDDDDEADDDDDTAAAFSLDDAAGDEDKYNDVGEGDVVVVCDEERVDGMCVFDAVCCCASAR